MTSAVQLCHRDLLTNLSEAVAEQQTPLGHPSHRHSPPPTSLMWPCVPAVNGLQHANECCGQSIALHFAAAVTTLTHLSCCVAAVQPSTAICRLASCADMWQRSLAITASCMPGSWLSTPSGNALKSLAASNLSIRPCITASWTVLQPGTHSARQALTILTGVRGRHCWHLWPPLAHHYPRSAYLETFVPIMHRYAGSLALQLAASTMCMLVCDGTPSKRQALRSTGCSSSSQDSADGHENKSCHRCCSNITIFLQCTSPCCAAPAHRAAVFAAPAASAAPHSPCAGSRHHHNDTHDHFSKL